ncbi:MAG: hypothetical protein JNM65_08905 [Verrucomicrobiaceae bacterium]|nr:hypothetical protein [Verrucomicrobiaceae bacterium]
MQLDDTLLLIEPEAAKAIADERERKEAEQKAAQAAATSGAAAPSAGTSTTGTTQTGGSSQPPAPPAAGSASAAKSHSFFGSVEVNPSTAKMRLVQLAEEIISVLSSDPNAELKVTMEISADFPNGVSDQIKRAVSENANSLGFKTKDWE